MATYIYSATKAQGGYQATVLTLPDGRITTCALGASYPKATALKLAEEFARRIANPVYDSVRKAQ